MICPVVHMYVYYWLIYVSGVTPFVAYVTQMADTFEADVSANEQFKEVGLLILKMKLKTKNLKSMCNCKNSRR
jgi:hypothetical protein